MTEEWFRKHAAVAAPLRAPLTRFTLSQQVAAQKNWCTNTILTMLFVDTAR